LGVTPFFFSFFHWFVCLRVQTIEQANAQLDLELVQADCYLLGSMAQLLLGSYVKGCVNLRAAW
jgi:hypothetical protein